jgi:tripartite-type tricarboxylate transporter receptor subunit TctC
MGRVRSPEKGKERISAGKSGLSRTGSGDSLASKLKNNIWGKHASAEVKDRFAQLNVDIRATTPEEFRAFVKEQTERWGKVVKEANIKLG